MAGLGYAGNIFGANLSYNRYGKRILAGGTYPWQDQYEKPRDVLDLQLSAALLKNKMQVRFNISDLFQQDYVVYQNVGTSGAASSGGGSFLDLNNENQNNQNINNDPKGTSYNKEKDFTCHKWFKGRNLSATVSYTF